MRLYPLVMAGLTAALLGACALGPAYQRPASPSVAQWIDGPGPGGAPPTAQWWRGFGSSELSRLMGDLANGDPGIAVAAARIREAQAQAQIAGAPLLPSVTGNAAISRSQAGSSSASRSSSLRASSGTTYETSTSATISASYETDFWGKNAATAQAAQATAKASQYDSEVVALTDEATLATDYFNYLSASARAELARRNFAAAQDIRDAIKDQVALGTSTSVDLAQQENVVAAARAAIPPLDQAARQDLVAISILVGQTPESFALDAQPIDRLTIPEVSPGLPSVLLGRRPDVSEAEADLIAANADIRAARAAFFPSIGLTGQAGYSSVALSTLLQPGNLLLSVGASATQTIFDNGALSGQLAYNRARYDELLATYHQTVLTAFSDVETALVAVQKTGEEEADEDEAVAEARNAYQLVQDQVKGGVATITSVLNTEQSLFQAQDAQIAARINHLEAVVSLFRALGGGWQDTGR